MRQNAGFFFLKGAFAHFLLRKFLFQNSSFGASHYVNMVTVKWLQWWLFFVNFNMGVSLIWYESGFNIFKFFLIARNITRNVMGWDGVRVLVQASFWLPLPLSRFNVSRISFQGHLARYTQLSSSMLCKFDMACW